MANSEKIHRFITTAIILLMAVIFVVQFFFSFSWRQFLDTPLLNYAGYLINDEGRIPYQQIFETSMPGTLLFHSLLGKTLGYSDSAVRIADSFFLLVAMLLVFLILKPFSQAQGSFAALLFGLLYQSFGPKMALQRDFLGTVALAGAVLLSLRFVRHDDRRFWPLLAAGFCVGIAASFKPHLGIILPLLIWFAYRPPARNMVRPLLLLSSGAVISFAIPFLWLWQLGGLPAFAKIFFNYLPLHTQIGHDFTLVQWPEKLWYSISGLLLLNDHLILLLLALIGIYIALKTVAISQPRQISLLSLSALFYFLYPAISGQFWFYHWAPFLLFAAVAVSFMLPYSDKSRFSLAAAGALACLLPLQISLAAEMPLQLRRQPLPPPLAGVPDQISDFLQKQVKPGETVQALDWVNGAIHGMLTAKTPMATKFLYDYHFSHHISNPFIISLRQEFMQALQEKKPDYFIFVFFKSRVSGPDTSQDFPELGKFIFSNYNLIFKTEQFGIFKKK